MVATTTFYFRLTLEELNKIIAYAEEHKIYDDRHPAEPNKSEAVRRMITTALRLEELKKETKDNPKLLQERVDELTAQREQDHELKWLEEQSYDKLKFIIEEASKRKEAIYEERTSRLGSTF